MATAGMTTTFATGGLILGDAPIVVGEDGCGLVLPRAQDTAPESPDQSAAESGPDLPDVSHMADTLDQHLSDLSAQWVDLSAAQKQQLVDQVHTTAQYGHVTDLPDMHVDTAATAAALTAAMVTIAAVASGQMVTEAAAQGVELATVHLSQSVFGPVAHVVARLLADELRITAARAALRTGPDATPTEVAEKVRAALDGLSDAGPTRELGGSLHGAMNTARIATLRRAPEGAAFASEINDRSTCSPCHEVDGRWLGNVPSDLAQIERSYPAGGYGGYVDCLGGIRCRGTVVGVWRPKQGEVEGRAAGAVLAKTDPPDGHDHHAKPDYTAGDLDVDALYEAEVNPQVVNADRQHYQRDLDPERVAEIRKQKRKKIAARWGLLGRRGDGSHWVINGQHHTQAALEEGIPTLNYRVFDSDGWVQEAEVFAAWQRWHDQYHASQDAGRDADNNDEQDGSADG